MEKVKNLQELTILFENCYMDNDITDDHDPHNINVQEYYLDEEYGVIINHWQSGDIVCGCDYCYGESWDVIACIE